MITLDTGYSNCKRLLKKNPLLLTTLALGGETVVFSLLFQKLGMCNYNLKTSFTFDAYGHLVFRVTRKIKMCS